MEKFISEDLKLAVKKGAAWLDENHPDWAYSIDLSELDMNHCSKCVIGQAVCDYFDFLYDDKSSSLEMEDWSIEHGFNVVCKTLTEEEQGYRDLETLWTEQVKDRLG